MIFVVAKRFKVNSGYEEVSEDHFRHHTPLLEGVPGFFKWELHRPVGDGWYASITHWESRAHYDAWRRSQAWESAHRDQTVEGMFATPSEIEMTEVVQSSYSPLAFLDSLGYEGALSEGVRSPGVFGTYTPEEALQRLLAGSGLTHRFTNATTVTLERAVAREEPPEPLSPVTVTARRVATPIANIPGSVQVIEQEEIQEQSRAHRTLQDALLRLVPGLNLGIPEVNDGTGGGPPIRGRPALVLYNGVPVNTLTRFSAGDALLLLDPDNVERIEVVRGANATYGFGAAGGVINIITPTGKDQLLTVRSQLGTSFNPVRLGQSLSPDTSHRVLAGYGPFDVSLGFAYRFRNSAFDPAGRRVAMREEYHAYGLDGSLGYDLGRAGQLRLAGTFYHRDVTDDFQPDEEGIRKVRFQEGMRQPGGDG